jgi:ubiquinol-cytochrome c reductase cytochrome c1 subunit
MKLTVTHFLAALGITAAAALVSGSAFASEEVHLEKQEWSFDGIFGQYDQAALRRGYQVYKDVCAGCHSMEYVAYRNLGDAGSLGLSEDEVKAIAKSYEVPAGPNDDGETTDEDGYPLMRPATPADYFVAPYANEEAALASNGGALPPDLSLMAKARKGGPDYLYNLLMNYEHEVPHDYELNEGLNYNPIFLGGQLAMAQPLYGDDVEFEDGTEASLEQEARDVAHFLMWAAEPKLNERKEGGFKAMIFLLILTGLTYWSYRRVWSDLH